MNKLLSADFFARPTAQVAYELLGKQLVRTIGNSTLTGIIVETEAYTLDDPACHAFKGCTPANKALFGPVGHAYVYFIYGNHYCFNIVAHDECTQAGGVLIRALEPVEGIAYMQKIRGQNQIKNLTNGPGKLAQALHITKKQYGIDLTKKGELYVTECITIDPANICSTTRIGISKAQETLWRFYICDNPFVSKK